MSFENGWAALNLKMPKRVPRTEYSAESHWELVKTVTSIEVDSASSEELRQKASAAFVKAWNYDFVWNVLIFAEEFGDVRTDMGHAEYATDGTDKRDSLFCPFNSPEEVLGFDPWEAYGEKDHNELVARFEADYKTKCQANPDAVNMTGIYITLMSGLIDIFGWDMLLMAAGTDGEKFGQLTNRYAQWIKQYFDALADSQVPVVMVHDDIVWTSGPFISPDWYRKYIFPNYKTLFAPLKESEKKIMYTSDGNYTMFIDDIVQVGVNGFVMEPITDMQYVAEKYGKTHSFIGNADTRILLNGGENEIRAEVQRCMDIGKHCPGFFMAVGNHIPANTPVENAILYNNLYEELGCR